jgi:hypothetical protein
MDTRYDDDAEKIEIQVGELPEDLIIFRTCWTRTMR